MWVECGRVQGGYVSCHLTPSSFGESLPPDPRSHTHTVGVCTQQASLQALSRRTYTPPALHQTDVHDERLLQPIQAHTEPGQSG